jgi:hypothetical protein
MHIKFERTIHDVDLMVSNWKSGWQSTVIWGSYTCDIKMVYIKWGSVTIYMIQMETRSKNSKPFETKSFWGTLSQCEDWFTNQFGESIEIVLSDYDTVLNNLHTAAKEKKRKESEALSDV